MFFFMLVLLVEYIFLTGFDHLLWSISSSMLVCALFDVGLQSNSMPLLQSLGLQPRACKQDIQTRSVKKEKLLPLQIGVITFHFVSIFCLLITKCRLKRSINFQITMLNDFQLKRLKLTTNCKEIKIINEFLLFCFDHIFSQNNYSNVLEVKIQLK